MAYISIMIVILSIAVVVAVSRQEEINRERIAADAKNVLNEAVAEIDIATEVGSGYSHYFSLPDMLVDSTGYSIGISRLYQDIYIEWQGKNYSLAITTVNINGSFSKGGNKISNIGGLVVIESSDTFH